VRSLREYPARGLLRYRAKNYIPLEQDPGVAQFFEEVKIFLKDASWL
jgi:hypothetical protein